MISGLSHLDEEERLQGEYAIYRGIGLGGPGNCDERVLVYPRSRKTTKRPRRKW